MKRTKLLELSSVLGTLLTKAEERARNAQESYNEISKSSYNSPSQSGDRYHSQSSAELTKENLINIKDLYFQVKESLGKKAPERLQPICYVVIEYSNGMKDGFYFVKKPIANIGHKIISRNSIIGGLLNNKRVGYVFSVKNSQGGKTAKIISIE